MTTPQIALPPAPVAHLAAALDAAQRDAEAATPGPWEPEGDDPTDDIVFTMHDGEHGDLVGGIVAYVRGGYGKDPGDTLANMRLIAAYANPASVLRRIAADRKTLALHVPIPDGDGTVCAQCANVSREEIEGEPYPCATVRNLAEGWG